MSRYLPLKRGCLIFARWTALATAAALQSCTLLSSPAGVPPRPEPAASVDAEPAPTHAVDVQAAQRALSDLGYYTAAVDGLSGPRTRAAVVAYQKDAKLPVTGELSADLVAHLRHAATEHERKFAAFRGTAQPVYEIGDRFFYSDGSSETVLSIEGPHIIWESSDGSRRRAPWNFLLPALTWWSERGTGSAETDAAIDLLWPFTTGGEARFSATMTRMATGAHPIETVETWSCRVRAPERLSIPAGDFDTIPVSCHAQEQPSGAERTVVWNYAPAVGHFVRRSEHRTDTNGVSQEDRFDLVAVGIGGADWPAVARAGLEWAFQYALENEAAGHELEWKSTAVADRIMIKPLDSMAYVDGVRCRRFEEIRLASDGMKRIYPGVACRGLGGHWAIPETKHQARADLQP